VVASGEVGPAPQEHAVQSAAMRIRHLRKHLKAPFRRARLRREWRMDVDEGRLARETVSAVMVTYNRKRFLQWSVDALLRATKRPGFELLVWNNASTDGTEEVLAPYAEAGLLRVVNHDRNIGTNAYHEAFEGLPGSYYLELDDDVLWLPDGWLETMLRCFQHLPRLGYLGAAPVHDRYTAEADPLTSGRYFYDHVAFPGGTRVAFGPVAGFCALTPRRVYEEVGGFPRGPEGSVFVSEDGAYNRAMRKAGYLRGILESLAVYHASGRHCNADYWNVFVDKLAERSTPDPAPSAEDRETIIPGFIDHFRRHYLPPDANGRT